MNTQSVETAGDPSMKWGYAFAGACALGFAALIQTAFDGLDEEMLEKLPALVAVPYGFAGKLGITVPLALLGVGLILRDVLVNQHASKSSPAQPRRNSAAPRPKPGTAPVAVIDLEEGEPIADEVPPVATTAKPAKKIAALAGGFGGARQGQRDGIPAATGGPVGHSEPLPQRPGSGQVVLSSSKYLNRNPGGSFRRGTTNHSRDE